ncbi:hypothetical protein GXP67_18185 [Rhodocytophaga rosea]|uniref:Uncharacterized protein n=1 Tax=Rhodocytophaga rosea TaxID=2704465 RepID=A0A6C0GLA3_9BACT|nr:hypothetical protein [Rhodocytophaga rosea]QHT68433.1 hypothetical protein GXP67_18185 [Rhodocytophaga rosea]
MNRYLFDTQVNKNNSLDIQDVPVNSDVSEDRVKHGYFNSVKYRKYTTSLGSIH